MAADLHQPIARYNKPALVLHWVIAAFITVAVIAGLTGASTDERRIVDFHKSVGLTLFGLIVLRLLWRLAKKPPPFPNSYPKWERRLAHLVHFLLYAVMLALPITGYIHDSAFKEAAAHPLTLYGLPFPRLGPVMSLAPAIKERVHDVFGNVHVYIGYGLYGLFALHLLGVAKHHAIDHEPELQRMLPEGYRRPDPAE